MFDWTYSNDEFSHYIRVVPPDNNRIDGFKMNMLNQIPSGLIACHSACEKGVEYLDYSIGSLMPLYDYLNHKKLDDQALRKVLLSMIATQEQLRTYLLYTSDLWFDTRQMYIDVQSMKLYLIYLPFQLEWNEVNFRDWLLEFIMRLPPSSGTSQLIATLFGYTKQDVFTLVGLKQLLLVDHADERTVQVPDAVKPQSSGKNKANRILDKKSATSKKEIGDYRYMLAFGIMQLGYLTLLATSLIAIKKMTADVTEARLGATLILTSTNALLYLKLFKDKLDFKVLKSLFVQEKKVHRIINEEADSIGVSSELLVDSPKFLQEDTTVLVCADSTVPYLLRLSTGEKHFISKPCLLIGRQKDVVDIHLSDSSIGRTHAEINFTGGACVIRDLFSKNGTFINEERVEVNKPIALAVGDQLKLADVELVYHEG